MNLQTKRWLLAPARQWRTRRLMAQHGPTLPYPTAWALVTLRTNPDEITFVRHALHETVAPADAGLHFDDWNELSGEERDRRTRWLRRHGCSPVQRMGITGNLLQAAGIRVVDWGEPAGQT